MKNLKHRTKMPKKYERKKTKTDKTTVKKKLKDNYKNNA